MHGWSQIGSSPYNASSLPVVDVEQGQGSLSINMNKRSDASKEDVENVSEDGELTDLVPVSAVVNNAKVTPPKGSDLEHSKRLSLISKSMVSPIGMPKSLSFKKNDDDSEIMLDSESDLDEAVQIDQDTGNAAGIGCLEMVENFWADYGVQEYCLVLTRTVDDNKRNMKLEAKVSTMLVMFAFVFSIFFSC